MFDQFRFTDNSRKALENAQQEARAMGFNYVGTEHLLLGILDVTECQASQILVGYRCGAHVLFNRPRRVPG